MPTDNLAETIRGFAERVTRQTAIELVHVEIGSIKNKRVVRIFIDKEDGVTHEDCSFVSHAIEDLLDQEDPIAGEYVLEVSSPGIERGLYTIADFERFKGNEARLKTHEAFGGQRNFRGMILGVEESEIEIDDLTSGRVRIQFGQILKANLTIDMDKELKDSRHKKKKGRAK